MTTAGWIVMLISVGGTTSFFVWCIRRVLREPDSAKKMHGVLDTEMQIEEEEKSRDKKP